MSGLRRLFFAAVASVCLWRAARHVVLHEAWMARYRTYDAKSRAD